MLKSLFVTSFPRLEFINCLLSIKTNFSFQTIPMYFYSLFVTTPLRCASKFTSYMTMISYFFIVIIIKFFTNPASVTRLKFFFFFTHYQMFVKMFFYYFFIVFILLKNCFNKFISSVFTSKNNYWLSKCIINANKFVSKNIRNMILKLL